MKKQKLVLGIIAILAVIGFMILPITGCDLPEDIVLSSIAVTTEPTQMEYAIDEEFDTTGMVVTATYSNGTTGTVDLDDCGFEYDFSEAGEAEVLITYNSKLTSITVTVYESVATPTATPGAGNTFLAAQTITLSSETDGAEIYYTLDGTDPDPEDEDSTLLYDEDDEIIIDSTTTLKAIAVKDGMRDSAILTAVYTFIYKPLTYDEWGPTGTSAASSVEWYKFTATGIATNIHFQPGTSPAVYATVYEADGTTANGSSSGSSYGASTLAISRTTVVGKTYFIKITPYYSSSYGTYKIGVNDKTWSPPSTVPNQVINITNGQYADGNFITSTDEQWFKFTAPGTSIYIHLFTGKMYDVLVFLYDAEGRLHSSGGTDLYGTLLQTQRTGLTNGGTYYVKARSYYNTASYTGAYKIGVTANTTPPAITIPTGAAAPVQLTTNTWSPAGDETYNIANAGEEKWFKVTASGTDQYVHLSPTTLSGWFVQVFDSSGIVIQGNAGNGGMSSHAMNALSARRTGVTNGSDIYVRIKSNTTTGKFQIAVNGTAAPPPLDLNLGPIQASASSINSSIGAGNILTEGDEEWFKFSATGTSQSIIFLPGTLTSAYIRVYDTTGALVGGAMTLLPSGSFSSLSTTNVGTSRSGLTNGSVYLVRVTPTTASDKGTYQLGLNMAQATSTNLTANTWSNVNITTTAKEVLYKFTATATTQYIHCQLGTITDVFVNVYNNDGIGITLNRYNLYGANTYTYNSGSSGTITNGTTYYIRTAPYTSTNTGTYKIGFTNSLTAPTN